MAERIRETSTTKPRRNRELRLALAMRGGLSLAVWIGGAVAEIDRLRRRIPDAPYAGLLARAGYTSVIVDVLAGASAGGLNAVLYGYAQHRGVDIGFARRVWQEQGALWKLMRPAWKEHDRYSDAKSQPRFRVPSVLSGGYFYAELAAALARQEPSPLVPDEHPKYLSIDLSATLRHARFIPPVDPEPGEDQNTEPEGNSEAHFRFLHTEADHATAYNDFHPDDDRGKEPPKEPPCEDAIRARRLAAARPLALAARSTSSFPGAFEPAIIPIRTGNPDMARVFGAEADPTPWGTDPDEPIDPAQIRPVTGYYEVIDGGIFDNIPIDRAVAAITASPADGPTGRVLFYLDPTPPDKASPMNRALGTSLLANVTRTLALRQRSEVADAEIGRLRGTSDDEYRAAGRAELLASGSDGPDQEAAAIVCLIDADDLTTRFVGHRAAEDAALLADTLVSPRLRFLRSGVDPVHPIVPVDVRESLDLQGVVRDAYRAAAGADGAPFAARLMADETSVLACTDSLLTWVRALEAEDTSANDAKVLAEVKSTLYRVRAVASHMQDLTLLFWARRSRQLSSAEQLVPALRTRYTAGLDSLPATHREVLNKLHPLRWASESVDSSRTGPLWEALTSCFRQVRTVQPIDPRPHWKGSILPRLARLAVDTDLQALTAAIAVTGGPLRGLGGVRGVKYRELTGDCPPAIEVPAIHASIRDAAAEGLVSGRDTSLRTNLAVRARDKLGGSLFFGFGGFLDAGWRIHDWTWGRADASSTLIDLLAEDICDDCLRDAAATASTAAQPVEAPPRCTHDRPVPNEARRVDLQYLKRTRQETIVAEEGEQLDASTQRWADLAPSYRFGVLARMVQLTFRGLWPVGTIASSVPPPVGRRKAPAWPLWLMAGLLALLRPLLVLVPLAIRPAALVAGLAPLVILTHPVAPGIPRWLGVTLLGLLGAAGLITSGRLVGRSRAWATVAREWADPRYASRARHNGLAAVVIGLPGIAFLAAAAALGLGTPGVQPVLTAVSGVEAVLVALAGIAVLQAVVSTLGSAPRSVDTGGDGRAWAVAAVAVAVALLLRLLVPDWWILLVGLAAFGVALAAQHGWAEWLPATAASLVAAVFAIGLTAVFGQGNLFVLALLAGGVGAAVTTLWLRARPELASSRAPMPVTDAAAAPTPVAFEVAAAASA